MNKREKVERVNKREKVERVNKREKYINKETEKYRKR